MQDYQKDIRSIAAIRGVTKLYHFTPLTNVASILKNGLASQNLLDAHGIGYMAPDRQRLDNRLDAVSLSIHSFNKPLLMKKVAEYGGDWSILEIDASVLWTHSCRFCWTNAASAEIVNHCGFLGGKWGFGKMFDDRPISMGDARSQRTDYGRLDNQPTDIQAEVQVFDPIDSDLVIDITVKSLMIKSQVETLMDSVGEHRPVAVNERIY